MHVGVGADGLGVVGGFDAQHGAARDRQIWMIPDVPHGPSLPCAAWLNSAALALQSQRRAWEEDPLPMAPRVIYEPPKPTLT